MSELFDQCNIKVRHGKVARVVEERVIAVNRPELAIDVSLTRKVTSSTNGGVDVFKAESDDQGNVVVLQDAKCEFGLFRRIAMAAGIIFSGNFNESGGITEEVDSEIQAAIDQYEAQSSEFESATSTPVRRISEEVLRVTPTGLEPEDSAK